MSTLLSAQVPLADISKIVGCGKTLVKKVKKLDKKGKGRKRKPGSGGHNKKLTEDFLTGLACEVKASLTTSMCTFAKDINVSKDINISKDTVRNAVKIWGFHSYVCQRHQLLTTKNREKRVKRGKRIMSFLKKKRQSTVLVFSDKKNWTVDRAQNARNDRYLAFHVEEVPSINVTKHPQSAMMLGIVCSDSKRMVQERTQHWGKRVPEHHAGCGETLAG